MVTVKRAILLMVVLLLAPISSRSGPATDHLEISHTSLFAQGAAQALNQDFPDPDISFLLLDARSRELLASRWDRPDIPIPTGSLAKPFAALAYGGHHDFQYPSHTCRGTPTGCWRPGGHGDVDLVSAIAFSCNSYFRVLTEDLNAADLSQTADHFGIEPPDHSATGMELAGLGPRWRISPLHLVRAYLDLLRKRDNPAVSQILAGMARSAREGTGAEVDRAIAPRGALVKTGTAPCTEARPAPGDGLAVVFAPAQEPRILLMVRVHGVPGSRAARVAGQMVRRIGE
jgi:cell division protein FtsI/penicillin-binding protein 2